MRAVLSSSDHASSQVFLLVIALLMFSGYTQLRKRLEEEATRADFAVNRSNLPAVAEGEDNRPATDGRTTGQEKKEEEPSEVLVRFLLRRVEDILVDFSQVSTSLRLASRR